jgi:hypothetical protein
MTRRTRILRALRDPAAQHRAVIHHARLVRDAQARRARTRSRRQVTA